ncbi:S8 family peptidase [Dyadobacter luticola]|uniref:T9SS type A sorting domain-containing protein n=1 Tax=Dyadobacter luticola TaxID=1979387 RepID=A0A5R9KY98_9BACT|nr:S8 family peptidase [Dyadobacter luticola]TLV01141.1 T9SS type A sorting domain-containing protein [Dyadobacter luticola]
MTKNLLLTLAFICAAILECAAQTNPRYLVLFNDKANSPYTVAKPAEYLSERAISRRTRQNIPISSRDFPVNPAYIAAVKQTGATIIYSSRWFNGSLVEASATQLAAIKKLAFFKGIELDLPVANLTSQSPGIERVSAINKKFETEEEPLSYGSMNAQLALMEVPALHQKGLHGEGMLVAILDNGFSQGEEVGFLKTPRDEKRIVDTHDFVDRDGNVYNNGSHGLNVLSTIAAYQPGTMIGAAFKASFALYHTENDGGESPYEEITWLLAAERADSLGVDVINSSLGYTTFDGEFDTDAYNHTYEDMDGKTTIISRAARIATRTGMIVTVSAGNDGNKSWHYISAPADVDSVLSVGATTYDRTYAAFSSVGPNAAGQMKPDISAVGAGAIVGTTAGTASSSNGTSFSSPLIAGLATVLWQEHPSLTAQQIIYVLKKSGHNAANPDNMIGYGVPSVTKAEEIIQNEFMPLGTEKEMLQAVVVSPNPAHAEVTLTIPQTLVGKNAELNIYGATGSSHFKSATRLSEKHNINTRQLPAGLYLIHLKVENQERTLKFIKN